MQDRITVFFENLEAKTTTELEIPTDITANDLVLALNSAYDLGMDTDNIFHCYLVSENPIAFLRGNRRLSDFGIHHGTRIIFQRG